MRLVSTLIFLHLTMGAKSTTEELITKPKGQGEWVRIVYSFTEGAKEELDSAPPIYSQNGRKPFHSEKEALQYDFESKELLLAYPHIGEHI
jgi:hypothetical protein